ncbi:nucleotidyltransferase domain-containing protein [Patescibacteria group bacterium]|nr:nucleotidyltransferase domain-containing protein [Patescibacteria group bacterium]
MDFSKTKLNKIAEEYQLADIYLFGSQVSGFQRKESDFDIGVRFKKGLPKKEKRAKIYGNLFSDLNLCFKDKKIDLVFIEEVPLHFQFKIINNGELIYFKDLENSLNFQEKIVNYYRDYKYFIDEYFQGVLEVSTKT